MISGYGFINIHNTSQCYDSGTKDMYGDVEKGDVSSVYGFTNIQNVYQLNVLRSLMNYNYRDDMDTNDNVQNV